MLFDRETEGEGGEGRGTNFLLQAQLFYTLYELKGTLMLRLRLSVCDLVSVPNLLTVRLWQFVMTPDVDR